MMKDIAWAIFLFATTTFSLRLVTDTTLTLDSNPIGTGFVVAYFVAGALGAFWMVSEVKKHERKLTKKLFLAFIPYGFLYYYFQYVRKREPVRGPQKFNPYR